MPGPNEPSGGSGSSGPGSGSEASETISGFGALRSLVENEERVERLYRNRIASFDDDDGQGRGPYRQKGQSTPLIMTTESFAAQGRYIIFWVGPRSVQWRFPMRAAQQQTRSGTILHTWRNASRSTFFDEPEVTFTFQAGNIMPVRFERPRDRVLGGNITALPAGLFDFYEFFDLLNEEKILSDGRPNFVFIAYHSLVYPEIFLRGFFTPDGVSFSEDAQNPAELTWDATFKVRSTSPPFYNSSQLLASWQSAFTDGYSTVLIPASFAEADPPAAAAGPSPTSSTATNTPVTDAELEALQQAALDEAFGTGG